MAISLCLTADETEETFARLAEDYRLTGPVRKPGRGRFAGTDTVEYDAIEKPDELEFRLKSDFSAKTALLPTREVLFVFDGNGEPREPDADSRPTVLFLRACDIHALEISDAIFLRQDGCADPYYRRRRERLYPFLIECATSFESCFCASMGTNRAENHAAFIRPVEGGYQVRVNDARFNPYFARSREIEAITPRFPESNPARPAVPESVPEETFSHPMWREYSRRCIGCGRCTLACPTCGCFSVRDVPAADAEGRCARTRIASSCQVKRFGELAGGHDFRIPTGDRMRYRVLHKFIHYKARHGRPMCVGCGRCDDVCPEYIGISQCLERIAAISSAQSEVLSEENREN